ncbi:MAG: alpha/beta hydrolase [Methylocystis silviterrae]
MPAILLAVILLLSSAAFVRADSRWMTLPATPQLTTADRSGSLKINGANIWYAIFGRGETVILLHGGLANANYWGHQVPELAKKYQVVVMDSRGHGRSSNDGKPYRYELMADDVLGVMDALDIERAAIVGWSDGAIVGLDIAIRRPDRLTKLFAFAANSDSSGLADVGASPVFKAFVARAEKEYEALSPTPEGYRDLLTAIQEMWKTQPHYTREQLRAIKTPTWIVTGDHDEAIRREHTEELATLIPDAGLLIEPQVSHFSLLQDPEQFTADVMRFLAKK